MAFNGVLFQFGDYVFPNKYIKFDTYNIAPNQRQDLDSYTDGNGVTHRNALEHTKTQVQFIILGMTETSIRPILKGLTSNYINANERDANCLYYDPETGEYKTGHFYLDPSVQFRLKRLDENNTLHYGETQLLFIEY